MKILVTGGTGFIGKPLVQCLRQCMLGHDVEHDVRTVSRSYISNKAQIIKPEDVQANYSPIDEHYVVDLSNTLHVRRMLKHFEPEAIIHLAGNPSAKPDEVAPTAILDDNIKATQNLLHYCPEGTHFLFASSIVVYGNPELVMCMGMPIGAVACTEDKKCEPTSIYATTKLACEHLIKCYANYRNIRYKILRLCATVGPNLTHGIIKDFINKIRNNEVLEMFGDEPGSCKPYVHVDDVVTAFAQLLYEKRDTTLNICSRWSLTVNELADIVMEELGIKREKVWLGADANWKGDNPWLSADCNKAVHFGWNRKLDSEDAVRQCVKENM